MLLTGFKSSGFNANLTLAASGQRKLLLLPSWVYWLFSTKWELIFFNYWVWHVLSDGKASRGRKLKRWLHKFRVQFKKLYLSFLSFILSFSLSFHISFLDSFLPTYLLSFFPSCVTQLYFFFSFSFFYHIFLLVSIPSFFSPFVVWLNHIFLPIFLSCSFLFPDRFLPTFHVLFCFLTFSYFSYYWWQNNAIIDKNPKVFVIFYEGWDKAVLNK